MKTYFSRAYQPPAPVIEIELAISGTNQTAGPYPALVDTGADVTMLPRSLLISLSAISIYEKRLRSAWGEPHDVVIYAVDIIVGADRFPGIEIAADENETEFILGRNFLNRPPLLLDGPQMTVQLLNAPALQRLRAARSSE